MMNVFWFHLALLAVISLMPFVFRVVVRWADRRVDRLVSDALGES